jgi:Helix-turn-helix domain
VPKIAPDLFTVTEAAEELGLSPHSVRYAIMRGTLGVVELDKRTNLIPRHEIERYRRDHLRRRGPGARTARKPATKPAEDKE